MDEKAATARSTTVTINGRPWAGAADLQIAARAPSPRAPPTPEDEDGTILVKTLTAFVLGMSDEERTALGLPKRRAARRVKAAQKQENGR